MEEKTNDDSKTFFFVENTNNFENITKISKWDFRKFSSKSEKKKIQLEIFAQNNEQKFLTQTFNHLINTHKNL